MRDAAKELQEVRKTPDLPEPTLQYLNEFDKFLKKINLGILTVIFPTFEIIILPERRANVCTEV